MSLFVRAQITFPGWHWWPDAGGFLGQVHRHLFIVSAEVAVDYSDRAVEFFYLQGVISSIFREDDVLCNIYDPAKGVPLSCEAIAELVGNILRQRGYPVHEVTVSEDGENDGIWRKDL